MVRHVNEYVHDHVASVDLRTGAALKIHFEPGLRQLVVGQFRQGGITTLTGGPFVQNRYYDGEALGAIIHFNDHHSIWIQESYNKIVTIPWYTTASIGYTRSW